MSASNNIVKNTIFVAKLSTIMPTSNNVKNTIFLSFVDFRNSIQQLVICV